MSRVSDIQINTQKFPDLQGIDEEVEKALREQQKSRQYKDAGERVHGSRKEQALYKKLISSSDLQSIEQDEATAIELIKKDKVFPKIDPQKEKENGTDSGATFLKVKIRQAFPAQPYQNTKEAREQYVLMAEAISNVLQQSVTISDMQRLMDIATNGEIIEKTDFGLIFGKKIRNLVFAISGYTYNTGAAPKVVKLAQKYSGISKERAEQLLEKLKVSYDSAKKRHQECIDKAKQILSKTDMRKHKSEFLTFSGGMLSSIKTVAEYVEYVTKVCSEFIERKENEFKILSQRYPYTATPADWSWAETKQTAKSGTGADSKKTKIEAVPLSYIKRTGGLYIGEVDEHTVINKLHFKSLTLGNYVKDTEAKEHIRHFVSAIVDLCEVLDISLTINENLAIAFGAFGRGGKAMATYYPTRQLINLTKKAGDGSVAHEWGHFYDHFLNGFSMGKKALRTTYYLDEILKHFGSMKSYLTHGKAHLNSNYFKRRISEIINDYIPDNIFHRSMADIVVMLRFGYYHLGDELISFDSNENKKPTDSLLYYYSKQQGAYWKSIEEMFARSFECYVYDKLKSKERVNNYLVSGGNFSYPVYPQGKEREYINKCFDNLIYAMKEHLKIDGFKPFTTKRADEYIDLDRKGDVKRGVIVSKQRKLKLTKARAKAILIKQKQLSLTK